MIAKGTLKSNQINDVIIRRHYIRSKESGSCARALRFSQGTLSFSASAKNDDIMFVKVSCFTINRHANTHAYWIDPTHL